MYYELLKAFLYCIMFLSLIFLIELIVRKGLLQTAVSRRLAHIASGFFSIIMFSRVRPSVYLTFTVLLILVIAFSYTKHILKSVHNVDRKTHGEIYLPVGIAITYLISNGHSNIFVPAILILTLSDVVSGIISDWRDKGRASGWGSVGFFITTLLILSRYGLSPLSTVSIAFILTTLERISPYGSDNLTIPIAASLLLFYT